MPDDETLEPLRRVIVRRRGSESGPLVVCVAGIHGNEPAGIHACRRVSESLEQTPTNFKGEWLALAGNLVALRRNRRFMDEDLNRIWSAERIQDRRSGLRRHATAESLEQDEIMFEVESSLARNPAVGLFSGHAYDLRAGGVVFGIRRYPWQSQACLEPAGGARSRPRGTSGWNIAQLRKPYRPCGRRIRVGPALVARVGGPA